MKEVYAVYGVYDYLVKVETEDIYALKRVISGRIRKIDYIASTLTLITNEWATWYTWGKPLSYFESAAVDAQFVGYTIRWMQQTCILMMMGTLSTFILKYWIQQHPRIPTTYYTPHPFYPLGTHRDKSTHRKACICHSKKHS